MPADISTGQRLNLRFDEASGTNCIDSAGIYAGTMQGGTTRVAGKYRKAIDFDGATGRVSTTFNETLPNTATLACWVNTDTIVNNAGVMFSRGSAVTGINIYSAGSLIGYTWNGDINTYTWNSGLALTLNQWVFLALVIQPTVATFYCSTGATLNSAQNITAHAGSIIDALEIGRDSFGTRLFDGRIDEARVYNRALTPVDITALFNLADGRRRQDMPCGLVLSI